LFSSGSPVPNHEVRIVNDQGEEVPDRTEGFLWFRGPSATRGYFNNAEATQRTFFHLGPAPDGEYCLGEFRRSRPIARMEKIFVTGRVKDHHHQGADAICIRMKVEELRRARRWNSKGLQIVAFWFKR